MKDFSRRSLLKSTSLMAGGSALTSSALFGFSRAFAQQATPAAASGNDDTQTIISLAATAELFASTHYLAAINGKLGLADVQVNYLKAAFLAERDHYDLLISLGAKPVVTQFYVPDGLYDDVAKFAQITEVAETTFVSAYLAATRVFAETNQPDLAVTTAQIAGVEAEHRALIRQIGKEIPNNIPYAQVQFANVSDAVPVLQPFLDGKATGFIGPVTPPTDDQVSAIRAEADSLGYEATKAFAAS